LFSRVSLFPVCLGCHIKIIKKTRLQVVVNVAMSVRFFAGPWPSYSRWMPWRQSCGASMQRIGPCRTGGVLLKLGGAGTPVFVFPAPITPTSETCILILDKFHFNFFFETDESVS